MEKQNGMYRFSERERHIIVDALENLVQCLGCGARLSGEYTEEQAVDLMQEFSARFYG
jgi:hypothetical protein